MSRVAIVTDSTSSMPQEIIDKYPITVIPQVLIWGDQTYRDGIDINAEEFYTRLAKANIMPTTSQAKISDFQQVFTRLHEEGHEILCVLISSKLSGTIGSYHQAKEMLPEARIELVDSLSTSMGLGFQVIEAAKAAAAGKSLAECKAAAEQARERTGLVLTPATLEFLHRGGRIGGGARFLGTALNIKPILELRDGRIEAVERVRTRKKALKRIIDRVEELIAGRQPVHLAVLHANAPDEARHLLEMATRQIETSEKLFTEVSPVVGCHAGPGTVGLSFLAGM